MTGLKRVDQLAEIQKEANELFSRKNADYGDAFATYGVIGILVRLGDKIQRLQSITTKGINLVEDEKLRDTLMDLHNYAAMGIMLLDENKAVTITDTNHTPKETMEVWHIRGETDNYKRQLTTCSDGSVLHTCSCPSFKYCHANVKTCKHITGTYERV